jgi:acyl carrier protein
MTREEIRDRVYSVVKETLGAHYVSGVMIIEKAFLPDKWDKTMLIMNLQEAFNIDITKEDEEDILNYPINKIIDYIQDKLIREKI